MKLRPYHVFLLALLVRIGFMIASHGIVFTETRITDQVSFQNEATNIASSIVNRYGYESPFVGSLGANPHLGPTSWLGPVYPLFIALWFWVFGIFSRQAYFFIVLAQCVFSAATSIPIMRIGELTVGRRAGLIAAFLWAMFPWFSRWPVTWIWETSLSTLLFTLLFWFALYLERERSRGKWALFGVLWGFALLTSPALLTFFPLSLAWLALYRRRERVEWLKPALLATMTCAIAVSPWLIRNRLVFGQWVFIRSTFGFEFVMGNVHGGSGRDWEMRSPMSNPREFADYKRLGEIGYVRAKTEQAKAFVRAYPGEYLWLCVKRVAMFWDGSSMFFNTPVAWFWMPWSFLPLSMLFAPALVIGVLRRVHGWGLYVAAILFYPLPYYLVLNQPRYRNTLEPLMLLLLVYMVAGKAREQEREPLACSASSLPATLLPGA